MAHCMYFTNKLNYTFPEKDLQKFHFILRYWKLKFRAACIKQQHESKLKQNSKLTPYKTIFWYTIIVEITLYSEIFVLETLSELFLSDLLIPHRKLKPFHQRPLALLNEMSSGNAVTRRKLLSSWYFEDQLKETYTSFVLALNTVAHDTVDKNKEKAISAMYKLLAGNPEQEKVSFFSNSSKMFSAGFGNKKDIYLRKSLRFHNFVGP